MPRTYAWTPSDEAEAVVRIEGAPWAVRKARSLAQEQGCYVACGGFGELPTDVEPLIHSGNLASDKP
jgi:hypothetical protein